MKKFTSEWTTRRAEKICPGDVIEFCGVTVSVAEVHHFKSMNFSPKYSTPPCVLIVFNDDNSVSVEPHEGIRVIA